MTVYCNLRALTSLPLITSASLVKGPAPFWSRFALRKTGMAFNKRVVRLVEIQDAMCQENTGSTQSGKNRVPSLPLISNSPTQ